MASTSLKRAVSFPIREHLFSEREQELMLRLMDRAEEYDTGWADHWWRELKSIRRKLYGIED